MPTEIEIAAAESLDATGSFKEENAPSTVTLGPDGSFVFIDALGHASWSTNLRDQSPEMEKYLKRLKWDTLQRVVSTTINETISARHRLSEPPDS